ncbi:hypothetical protein GGQ85_003793 [Nitrobacter vulgaris]|uniref:CHASE3 domain-containing protein n=1 Tax=Nitrobacter vulgaris TaxID=29421 RepID=UPI00286319A9|nr:hypothetical protein [Nitrobacter vulgaris]MDR6306065.1 hypothetical protein [Nitrobacter vulgaris]
MKKPSSPDSSVTGLRLDPVVAISFAVAVIFFVISGAVAYFNFEAIRVGNENIAQSHRAIIALDELLSSVQDAETGWSAPMRWSGFSLNA